MSDADQDAARAKMLMNAYLELLKTFNQEVLSEEALAVTLLHLCEITATHVAGCMEALGSKRASAEQYAATVSAVILKGVNKRLDAMAKLQEQEGTH